MADIADEAARQFTHVVDSMVSLRETMRVSGVAFTGSENGPDGMAQVASSIVKNTEREI